MRARDVRSGRAACRRADVGSATHELTLRNRREPLAVFVVSDAVAVSPDTSGAEVHGAVRKRVGGNGNVLPALVKQQRDALAAPQAVEAGPSQLSLAERAAHGDASLVHHDPHRPVRRVPEKARVDAPAVPHGDQEQYQEHQACASEQRSRRTPCRLPREQQQERWKQDERDRADDPAPSPEQTSKGGGTESGCRFKRDLVAHLALYVTDRAR